MHGRIRSAILGLAIAAAPVTGASAAEAQTQVPGVSVAGAQTDPYRPGTNGYDVSFPQCGAAAPTGSFAVVGVNGGRPFSDNSCLRAQYSAAPTLPLPSLYINSGYSKAYQSDISSDCSNLSRAVVGLKAQRQAWAIGCTEAESSIQYANQQGATNVSMWWIDVETGNSWSTSNPSLNQYAIQGIVTRLGRTGLPVGVYSSAAAWATITRGSFTPQGIAADWEAPGGACATTGFTNSPVWLLQSIVSGSDADLAC